MAIGVFAKCLPIWGINPDLFARGASPLLITLFTMITVPGVLQTMEVIGVIMVSGAIITYGVVQYRTKSVGFTGIILAGSLVVLLLVIRLLMPLAHA